MRLVKHDACDAPVSVQIDRAACKLSVQATLFHDMAQAIADVAACLQGHGG
ncbi:MAG: hypothetical protein ACXWQ5_07230 [Ktedonobacterales bacterium]